ncbi:MAG: putative MATE family efflux protein, partial [Candidatus Krumholzibacteriia bacterium]
MTKGPLTPHLLAVAWPVSVSFLVQTMYNLIDTFWLGKLGKTALVAPTITLNVVFIGIALAMGLSQAGTTLVSQYKGAGRPNKMGLAAGQSVLLQVGVGVLIAVVGFIISKPVLLLLHTPPDAFDETLTYMRWIVAGLPLMFVFHVYQGILFGMGDTKSPMKLNIIAVMVNVVLDPILIFGWGPVPAMGVAGAAIATILARALAAGLAMRALLSGDGFRIRAKDLHFDREMFMKLLRVGLPLSAGQTATSLGFTLLIGIVNGFGSSVTAAFGIGHRVVMMVAVPAMGLSQA